MDIDKTHEGPANINIISSYLLDHYPDLIQGERNNANEYISNMSKTVLMFLEDSKLGAIKSGRFDALVVNCDKTVKNFDQFKTWLSTLY